MCEYMNIIKWCFKAITKRFYGPFSKWTEHEQMDKSDVKKPQSLLLTKFTLKMFRFQMYSSSARLLNINQRKTKKMKK